MDGWPPMPHIIHMTEANQKLSGPDLSHQQTIWYPYQFLDLNLIATDVLNPYNVLTCVQSL